MILRFLVLLFDIQYLEPSVLWLNEKRTTVVYKVSSQQTKHTTKEVVQ